MDPDLIVAVRKASLTDTPLLTILMRLAFTEAYAFRTQPEDLRAHMEANFTETRQQTELTDPQVVTLLAETDGQLIGYAQWHPGPSPGWVEPEQPVKLERLYVLKQYWGTGVAHRLMKSCLTQLSETSYTTVWLSCWTENKRALKFYRKWGFKHRGTGLFVVGTDRQTDVILARPISGHL